MKKITINLKNYFGFSNKNSIFVKKIQQQMFSVFEIPNLIIKYFV